MVSPSRLPKEVVHFGNGTKFPWQSGGLKGSVFKERAGVYHPRILSVLVFQMFMNTHRQRRKKLGLTSSGIPTSSGSITCGRGLRTKKVRTWASQLLEGTFEIISSNPLIFHRWRKWNPKMFRTAGNAKTGWDRISFSSLPKKLLVT